FTSNTPANIGASPESIPVLARMAGCPVFRRFETSAGRARGGAMKSTMKAGSALLATVLGISVLLASCGGTKSAAALNGRVLHVADLPDMRLRTQAQLVPAADAFVGALSQGDALLVKEPEKAAPGL